MTKFDEHIEGYRNDIKKNNGELPKDEWMKVYYLLEHRLSLYRNEWFEEIVLLVQEHAGNRKILCNFLEIPFKSLNSIKAFQVLGCVSMLVKLGSLKAECMSDFVRHFFKKISAGEEASCRGYFYRYLGNEHLIDDFLHDVTKDIIIEPMRTIVVKDEEVVLRANMLHVKSMAASAFAVGKEDDFLSIAKSVAIDAT